MADNLSQNTPSNKIKLNLRVNKVARIQYLQDLI